MLISVHSQARFVRALRAPPVHIVSQRPNNVSVLRTSRNSTVHDRRGLTGTRVNITLHNI